MTPYQEGEECRKNGGRLKDCPYAERTKEYKEWYKGYQTEKRAQYVKLYTSCTCKR